MLEGIFKSRAQPVSPQCHTQEMHLCGQKQGCSDSDQEAVSQGECRPRRASRRLDGDRLGAGA